VTNCSRGPSGATVPDGFGSQIGALLDVLDLALEREQKLYGALSTISLPRVDRVPSPQEWRRLRTHLAELVADTSDDLAQINECRPVFQAAIAEARIVVASLIPDEAAS